MFIYLPPEKGLHKNVEKIPRRRCLHGALGEVFRDQQRQDAAAPGIALGNRRGMETWEKKDRILLRIGWFLPKNWGGFQRISSFLPTNWDDSLGWNIMDFLLETYRILNGSFMESS